MRNLTPGQEHHPHDRQGYQPIAPAHDRRHDGSRLAPKTQVFYIRPVRDFAVFLGRSPDQAGAEDLRGYQLHWPPSGYRQGLLWVKLGPLARVAHWSAYEFVPRHSC